jgi:chromosome segregation protein
MSRLKELRLQGFKTFADAARFVFEPGVNAVIGPNGSGKSNMADGLRWVLGEQSNRALRTRRADDVIFAGSQQRKPTGMAEVVMTLDNADGWLPIEFAEVSIGRRAYRSGEAEYLINGARARLRDVVELLAAGQLGANALVVVGQGTVDAALSLRPEERRQLFEEAAGVKTLQVRKNEGLARLGRAEENLTRVSDLLGELKPQVRRLALQAQHQQEHDSIVRRGRAVVAEAHRRRERTVREALGDARRRAAAAEAAADAAYRDEAAGREALGAAESRYWAAEAEARRAAERREATREALIRLESKADRIAEREQELDAALQRAEEELAGIDATLARADEGGDANIERALAAAADAEGRWQDATRALASADAELVAAEEALAGARRRDAERMAAAARNEEAAHAARARLERAERELASLAGECSAAEAEVAALRETLDGVERRAFAARAQLATSSQERDRTHAAADEARRRTTALAERVAAAQSALEALDEQVRAGGRVGRRLADTGWQFLVDTVRAPEDAWPAIEAVVGGELGDALLWRDGDPAVATADARGTARLLDGRQSPSRAERSEALAAVHASQTLAEWISGEGQPGIFQRVALAPDLGSLLSGWRSLPVGWWAVTPHGDLADGRGMLAIRGRADPPGGAAARQVIRRRELGSQLQSLEREHLAAAEEAARAVAAAAASQRRLAETQRGADVAEADLREAATASLEANVRLDRAIADAARLQSEAQEAREGLQRAGSPGANPPTDAVVDHVALEARASLARSARSEAAAAAEALRDEWQATRQRADDLERDSAGGRQLRLQLNARREQLESMHRDTEAAIAALRDERAGLDGELTEARRLDAETVAQRSAMDGEREAARAQLLELERAASSVTGRLMELDRGRQQAIIDLTRQEEALSALERERAVALEMFEVEENDAGTDDQEVEREVVALDPSALEAEERRIRRVLAQIGSVNPFAVEEHRELAARLEDVSAQESDLRAAIGSTRELIGRLDAEIAERFGAAFRAIGQRFDEYARLLFAGGSASLEMAEPEDSETPGGIEIVVRPPGKRPQRLAMLSGGERALTGVALLFAMLDVNPVPFCILDEVDAALDEANIGRFAEALRKLAGRIDFVVITHNRATIEVADTIYGVTMTDAAVSRVLSLRLADVPEEVTA